MKTLKKKQDVINNINQERIVKISYNNNKYQILKISNEYKYKKY